MSASLANLISAQLALIPAANPLPGVIPNFVGPHSDGPIIFIVGSILVAIMLLLLGVRLYTKLFITRKRTWDDYELFVEVRRDSQTNSIKILLLPQL